MIEILKNEHQKWINQRFSSVQSLSCVQLFATPWTAARQASLSITNTRSPPKPMSIEPLMPSNHLKLCHPLLLLPSMFPSIRVFSNESALCIRWPKYWSFSFNISPSNEHPELISFRIDWLEDPGDRGARWAAVYRVAQSGTRLKRLSSSSSSRSTLSAGTRGKTYGKETGTKKNNCLIGFSSSDCLG